LERGTAEFGGSDCGAWDMDSAEGSEHEEDGYVSCCGVYCYGGGGDLDSCVRRISMEWTRTLKSVGGFWNKKLEVGLYGGKEEAG